MELNFLVFCINRQIKIKCLCGGKYQEFNGCAFHFVFNENCFNLLQCF